MNQTEEKEEKEKALKLLMENLAEYVEEVSWMVNDLDGRSSDLLDYCNFSLRLNDLRIQPYKEIKQLTEKARKNLDEAIQKISEILEVMD